MAFLVNPDPPCLLHEDDDLLVINKPPGINTHAPSPYAGEGIYDWLRNRQPQWADLAIIQRLDKETSGVLVFSKSRLANRSLTAQFSQQCVAKSYLLLTDRLLPDNRLEIRSALRRSGERYICCPRQRGGQDAVTQFRTVRTDGQLTLVEAKPLTGKTHQIRAHAAAQGFPALGDSLYDGSPAQRLCLHAHQLTLQHPRSGKPVTFRAAPDFEYDRSASLRSALINPLETDTWRIVHGVADDWADTYLDKLGDYLLLQSPGLLTEGHSQRLKQLVTSGSARAAYHKTLTKAVSRLHAPQVSPQIAVGEPAPARFAVRENGTRFKLSFAQGYSVGLFLDQRDNRRRLLTNHIAAGFPIRVPDMNGIQVLNLFAYTCGFSVCAALAGAHTTNIDLSRKYLDWGRENFTLNDLEPDRHEFVTGDVFDWLKRLTRKKRPFDLVILDPPTFSRSKTRGTFQARKDYSDLVAQSLPVLSPGGILFASCNAMNLGPEQFLDQIQRPILASQRRIQQQHYAPQPPDFPISRAEPAHLKTVWLKID